MVIESLHEQVQDLFFQVSQLNNKLVRSYYRVSDLEDELHVTVTSSNFRQVTIKISQLELERTQHLSGLSTGLLVKKSHVTTELTRLMQKATEEAARRGQAETAGASRVCLRTSCHPRLRQICSSMSMSSLVPLQLY